MTSGHATERGWQIGYRYKNGYLSRRLDKFSVWTPDVAKSNRLLLTLKSTFPIGNCLMATSMDRTPWLWLDERCWSEADAWVHCAHLVWLSGWGVPDYFVEQPSRYTLTEAFFANHHALIQRLSDPSVGPRDKRGLAFDRDVVAWVTLPGWPEWRQDVSPTDNLLHERRRPTHLQSNQSSDPKV